MVLVPDFFCGDYPDATAEQVEARTAFMQRQVDFPRTVARTLEVRKEAGEKWPEVEGHVGVFGLCFGGKIAVLVTGEGNEAGAGSLTSVGLLILRKIRLSPFPPSLTWRGDWLMGEA